MEDTFGRTITYLRLSVTDLCNYRCRYCMAPEGVKKTAHDAVCSLEELRDMTAAAVACGVRKVRITGGEPLVRRGIVELCRMVKEIPGVKELCLTTNGSLLGPLALPLREAGVDRLNISLDTLNAEKYAYITRRGTLNDALRGIEAAFDAGFKKLKINAVLIGGFNDDEITDLAALTMRYPVDVRFIELMPMTDSKEFGPQAYVPGEAVLEALPEAAQIENDGGVAALYRLPGAQGNIGLISAVSQHFCGSCNRIRLTADGKLKPCLHSAQEYNIKGLGYDEVLETMQKAIQAKPACHVPLSAEEHSEAGRSMNQIGG